MVVDRQKVKTNSESRRYSVAGRLEFRPSEWSGRWVQSPETCNGKNQEDKTNWHRETGTGKTEKISDTWR